MIEKTAKEKMLAGEPYSCIDSELDKLRLSARRLCKKYNDCWPDETEKRNEILKELFDTDDITFSILEPIWFDYGFATKIGKDVYISHNVTFNDNGGITIGDYSMIGPNSSFYTSIHPLDADSRIYSLPTKTEKWERTKPITIGKRCWIGGNVIVLPGVTIGDDVVIGAGSVVTKDIPSGVVAIGNPCHVIKTIENNSSNNSKESGY